MKNPLTVLCALGLACSGLQAAEVSIVEATVVNDSVPNAQTPFGMVRVGENELVAVFSDAGDLNPGAKGYLIRSEDLGKSWGEPYMVLSSDQPHMGIGGALVGLPDNRLLLIRIEMNHHSDDRTWDAVFKGRTCTYNLEVSTDGGKTFAKEGTLPSAPNSSGGIMGTVVTLANGDLILPAYQYPHGGYEAGHEYGSGFYRSTDKGKTWGPLEVAFSDPIPGRDKKLDFSEAAYVVRPDGSIVAYARIDSEILESGVWQSKGNNMWWIESKDNGQTWSIPKETSIGGLFPAIVRLGKDKYLMACGNRHSSPGRKVSFYTSKDGLDFQYAGDAPYVRTKGVCLSSATGGSQCFVPMSDREVYMIYYAADPAESTLDKTYIEGCLISVD